VCLDGFPSIAPRLWYSSLARSLGLDDAAIDVAVALLSEKFLWLALSPAKGYGQRRRTARSLTMLKLTRCGILLLWPFNLVFCCFSFTTPVLGFSRLPALAAVFVNYRSNA
jgi:hypothetical protein